MGEGNGGLCSEDGVKKSVRRNVRVKRSNFVHRQMKIEFFQFIQLLKFGGRKLCGNRGFIDGV